MGFQHGLSKFGIPQVHVHDIDVEPGQLFLTQADGEPLERRSFKLLQKPSENGSSENQKRRVFDVQFKLTVFNIGTR